ncbi:MAG: Rab family GTPase [Candidatus Hodarchaeota archaeon]
MFSSNILDGLLDNVMNALQDILACFIIDSEGLIITKNTRIDINEELIGVIILAIESTTNQIKKLTNNQYASGSFDIEDYRLFFVDISENPKITFILMIDNYTSGEKLLPYSYLIAEKISSIMKGNDTDKVIPEFTSDWKIFFDGSTLKIGERNVYSKLLVIGPEKSGKSSIVTMYTRGVFNREYKPTIGISYQQKEIQITRRMKLTFTIFDMAGKKSFSKIRRNFYQDPDSVMIVLDLSDESSIAKAKEWIEESRYLINNGEVTYFLVGNKIDAIKDDDITKKAKEMAQDYDCTYFETSALTGQGIDEMFTSLADSSIKAFRRTQHLAIKN